MLLALLPTALSLQGASASAFLLRSTTTSRESRISNSAFKKSQPSSPGWKGGQLDQLTEWATSDEANRPIICEYEPDALWLWTKWRGTALSLTYVPVLLCMAMCAGVDWAVHSFSSYPDWPLLSIPPADDPIVQQLQGINNLWTYQVTLCTFILAFFTSEAYTHWRSVYSTTRAIQGRINDICLLITIGAERGNCTEWGKCGLEAEIETIINGTVTGYSVESAALVRKCTRLIKLCHTFFWATTPTCSDGMGDGGVKDGDHLSDLPNRVLRKGDTIGPLLLSPHGLQGLVDAGELTVEEKTALVGSGLPPSQYPYILLEWVGLLVMDGIRSGILAGGNGYEENLIRQITDLRAQYFTIGDYTSGRMPLAYVQLVQILVDSLTALTPFAIYPELGSLAIPLAGLLTLFFKGLLELSKSFLDPFGNEGYPGQNIRVDTLVSELNFGATSRWVKAGESLPLDDGQDLQSK